MLEPTSILKIYPKTYMLGTAAAKRFNQTLFSSNWLKQKKT